MEQQELEQLVGEAEARGGGLVLSVGQQPRAVLLTVERYNLLAGKSEQGSANISAVAVPNYQPGVPPKQLSRVLVTGGAGYIGAHTVRELIASGYVVTVLDDLSTGRRENVPDGVELVVGDCGDRELLRGLLARGFDACLHFAASLEVEESVRDPARYYEQNVVKTAALISELLNAGCTRFVLSSTAAVYGTPEQVPVPETARTRPDSPYGFSKLLAERTVRYFSDYAGLQAISLRYFNAAGCDPGAGISSTHRSHLIPLVLEAAAGLRPEVTVHGSDYPTHDGTGVRDYVHVSDLARAHVLALSNVGRLSPYRVYNIGTGRGYSVREVIATAAEVTGRMVPMVVGPRRPGDAAAIVADATAARTELGFEPRYSDLSTIVFHAWELFQKQLEL